MSHRDRTEDFYKFASNYLPFAFSSIGVVGFSFVVHGTEVGSTSHTLGSIGLTICSCVAAFYLYKLLTPVMKKLSNCLTNNQKLTENDTQSITPLKSPLSS